MVMSRQQQTEDARVTANFYSALDFTAVARHLSYANHNCHHSLLCHVYMNQPIKKKIII